MQELRVGLIGFGSAGRIFHAPLIDATDGLQLTDIVSSRREEIQALWPGKTVYATADAFFDRADVDLVVVATPNDQHATQAREALSRGWDVVVDKPFTLTVREADELIALAAERDRLLTVFQNRRWDADYRTIVSLVEGGMLGTVHHFESNFDRFRPDVRDRWRERDVPGGGILYDLGPHLIDQAILLFGTPDWIQAHIAMQRSGAVIDDYFYLTLGYADRTAMLSAGMFARVPRPRFRVDGSLGTYIKHGLDPQEAALKAGGHPSDAKFGVEDAWQYGEITTDIGGSRFEGKIQSLDGAYVEFYRGIVAAIQDSAPVPVPIEQARYVIRVIEAAIESERNGRRVYIADNIS